MGDGSWEEEIFSSSLSYSLIGVWSVFWNFSWISGFIDLKILEKPYPDRVFDALPGIFCQGLNSAMRPYIFTKSLSHDAHDHPCNGFFASIALSLTPWLFPPTPISASYSITKSWNSLFAFYYVTILFLTFSAYPILLCIILTWSATTSMTPLSISCTCATSAFILRLRSMDLSCFTTKDLRVSMS